MVSYKEVLKEMVETLIASGADNFTLDYIRTLLREHQNLFSNTERADMITGINQTFVDRECVFAEN